MERNTSTILITQEGIDQYGHINYLWSPKYLELAQDALMKKIGISFDEVEIRFGLRSFVRVLRVDYPRQIIPGDTLSVESWISEIHSSSFILKQEATKADAGVVLTLEMVVAFADLNGNKGKIPDDLRAILSR